MKGIGTAVRWIVDVPGVVNLSPGAQPTPWVAQMPTTRAGYALSTAEQFAGLLLSALLLGVVVSKASIPSSKLVFSKARPQSPLQSVS